MFAGTGGSAGAESQVFTPASTARSWRLLRHFERWFMIQSVRALSKPMSNPAFSDSIHLCFKISSRSAWNSRYKDEFRTKSLLLESPFFGTDIMGIMGESCRNVTAPFLGA